MQDDIYPTIQMIIRANNPFHVINRVMHGKIV
jgi:hypothetical protein